MSRRARSYRDSLLKRLSSPAEAEAYLNAGLDDSLPAFLKALRNVLQAHEMAKVAKESGLQRETLYRSFSEQGNPTLVTLSAALKAVGLRISVGLDLNKAEGLELVPFPLKGEPEDIRVTNVLIPIEIKFGQDIGEFSVYGSEDNFCGILRARQELPDTVGPLGVVIPRPNLQKLTWSSK
jgi:probable addiction module antidote protein